jgi:hypothetical protein
VRVVGIEIAAQLSTSRQMPGFRQVAVPTLAAAIEKTVTRARHDRCSAS